MSTFTALRLCRRVAIVLALIMALPMVLLAQGTGLGYSPVELGSIVPFTTENGFISLSVDGLGSNSASGIIQVEKPAGATVRKAFMAAASTGFSGRVLANGDVKINGTNVVWNLVGTTPSSIASNNSLADVTSIVKPVVDAAPTGRVDFTITEVNTPSIDGEILAVIFDDPNQTTSNTIVLLFGAQNVAGDNFNITLANPINLGDPNLKLDMSLGISFGFQPSSQFSTVDVNGTRMTSSAGGQDDGQAANGALLTVGGLDDANTNPPPFSPPSDPRFDDELYNLIPFVTNGATSITVHTLNPSTDDNIFFSALFLGSTTAIVGEGILLTPTLDENPVGTSHTVTATVRNDAGQPVVGRTVNFEIVSGPHVGLTGSGVTDGAGQATFTYTGTSAGVDVIVARMVNSRGQTQTSNEARKVWRTEGDLTAPSCALTNVIPGPPKQIQVTVQDGGSGLANVVVLVSTNATVAIPPFTAGTTSPVVITATKIDQSAGAVIRLRVTDMAGNITECDPVYTDLNASVPEEFALSQAFPNPFNPTTTIHFSIPSSANGTMATLRVYDMLGREVKTLIQEHVSTGAFSVQWDGTDNLGQTVGSGMYLYRLVAGGFVSTKKMTLMK